MWAGQFYSRGAYTIFPHSEAQNATFPFSRRAGMWHFRPGVGKNDCGIILKLKFRAARLILISYCLVSIFKTILDTIFIYSSRYNIKIVVSRM